MMPSGVRGSMPPIVDGLQFFGDLSSPETSVVSGAVATLGDSSGNGRHATQGTASKRPAYTASDANFGGRPSMAGDGIQIGLVSPAFAPSSGSFTVFLVGLTGNLTSTGTMFGQNTGNGMFRATASAAESIAGDYRNPSGTPSVRTIATATIGVPFRYACVVDPSNTSPFVASYFNGSAAGSTSGTVTAGSPLSLAWSIFSHASAGAGYFLGSITDLLVYSSALSAPQVAQVDGWLKWRNGL